MSTSSPVRNRQPRGPSRPPKGGASGPGGMQLRSCQVHSAGRCSRLGDRHQQLFRVHDRTQASDRGRIRRQVDLVVQLMDQKRVEEERAPTVKQRHDRLEQNAPGLTGLTTSTINGKTTVVAPEPAPRKTMPAALIDDTAVARPDPEVRSQAPESSPNATAKHRDMQGVAHQRAPRRPKVPSRDPTELPGRRPVN